MKIIRYVKENEKQLAAVTNENSRTGRWKKFICGLKEMRRVLRLSAVRPITRRTLWITKRPHGQQSASGKMAVCRFTSRHR